VLGGNENAWTTVKSVALDTRRRKHGNGSAHCVAAMLTIGSYVARIGSKINGEVI
jgi:hypothetical protein